MRLHSDTLTTGDIHDALWEAQQAGTIPQSVYFEVFTGGYGSRSRARAFEVQLGCDTKVKGDNRSYKNSGQSGASTVWAATYDEWGFFIARLFEKDPTAIFGPQYDGKEAFHAATGNSYLPADQRPEIDPYPYIITAGRKSTRGSEEQAEAARRWGSAKVELAPREREVAA